MALTSQAIDLHQHLPNFSPPQPRRDRACPCPCPCLWYVRSCPSLFVPERNLLAIPVEFKRERLVFPVDLSGIWWCYIGLDVTKGRIFFHCIFVLSISRSSCCLSW